MSRVCPTCGAEAGPAARFCPACGGPVPDAAQVDAEDPYLGKTIAQKFYVQELVGTGGMGKVYKARHLSLDKAVCIKVLRKSLLDDPSVVARFQREARASSRLNHPNSIQVIDFGQAEDGALYLAMEYLAGRDLQKLLVQEFPLDEARVCHIMAQVCSALGDAHAAGIIHRDLKPENIMIAPRRDDPDAVKVLDFGIAKIQDPSGGEGGPALTRAGLVCGTPEYMSPEQARGAPLDPRSDVYAIGVILYQLMSGLLLFEADSPIAMVTKHLIEKPVPPRQRRPGLAISDRMEAFIMRCLEKEPAKRPNSAEEVRRELLILGGIPTPAHPSQRVQTPLRTQLFATPASIPAAAIPHATPSSVGLPSGGTSVASPRGLTDLGVLAAEEPASPPPPAAPVSAAAPAPVVAATPAVAPAPGPGPSTSSALEAVQSPRRGKTIGIAAGIAVLVAGGAWAALSGEPTSVAAAPSSPDPAPPDPVAPAPVAAPAPTPVAPAPAAPAPNPGAYASGTPGYFTEMGKQAFAKGDFDAAIESGKKALAQDGKWAEALKVIGMSYQAKGDPYRAVKAFKEYLRVAPYAADAADVKKVILAMGG